MNNNRSKQVTNNKPAAAFAILVNRPAAATPFSSRQRHLLLRPRLPNTFSATLNLVDDSHTSPLSF
ncbi:hypothetical protein BCR42DRAFT_418410 [Absidia repens]|uniref:Uncharacterized protein n=1 Tax=Absidia repens TaxID=90262 RepID=A0A1X2IBL1_9FUNG|nr:hypothetical protein BCR42DRAFT_418410 [Absidia repens]